MLPEHEPLIRVRLDGAVEGDAPMLIGGGGQPITIEGGGASSAWDGPIEVSRDASGWVIGGRGGPLPPASIRASTLHPQAAMPVLCPVGDRGEERSYPGTLELMSTDDEVAVSFVLINEVPMEEYLPGVLQAELFAGWPAATYEAQAVAARSFATMQQHHRASRLWDVTDTPATQAYMGMATDRTAIEAVRQTTGEVLMYDDQLVPGYFSSCCGGLPATAVQAVGPNPINNTPPLAGHAAAIHCAEAPVYSWRREVDAVKVHRALQAWAHDRGLQDLVALSGIEHIHPVDHNDHGRPVRLRLTDRGGREAQLDCVDITSALMDLPHGPPMSGWFSAHRQGGVLVLEGRGFGHGAGLCQYGAAAMGKAGASTQEILAFYYPGATTQRAWD